MKKVFLIGLAALLALLMVACGSDSGTSQPSSSETASKTGSTDEASKTNNSDTDPNMVTGTLYAPFAKSDIRERDFGYEEGTCTPEKIAAALTEWTGLVFDITSRIEDGDAVIIDWQSGSSFAEGQPPEPQKDGFEFYEADSMRWFMLNSLCSTIRVNMGIKDVFYSIEGNDMNDIGLDQDFNPAIAYNRIDNSNIVIK